MSGRIGTLVFCGDGRPTRALIIFCGFTRILSGWFLAVEQGQRRRRPLFRVARARVPALIMKPLCIRCLICLFGDATRVVFRAGGRAGWLGGGTVERRKRKSLEFERSSPIDA